MAKKKVEENVPKAIRNRIVGSGAESPEKLQANPHNWRTHPEEQREALEGLIEEVGWIQTVIKNKRTGHLIDGHLRVELARRYGEKTVPVVYVDLSPAEEKLALAMLDPIGAMAQTDKRALDKLLQDLDPGNAKAQEMIANLEEEIGMTLQEVAEGKAEDGGTRYQDGGATEEKPLLDQAVQLEPGKEFVVVMCEDEDEWVRLKRALDLKAVRRGGYKKGSPFDASGTERVVKAAGLLARLEKKRC